MKNARQLKILEIIENQPIDKQEELLVQLQKNGFNVTQATVSRDMRELRLVKTATGEGTFRYVSSIASKEKPRNQPNRFENIFKESVLRCDYAGNFVMVKCFTGMANAACEVFDSMIWNNVVGTLSGDDTFLILTKTEEDAKNLTEKLKEYIVL